MADGILSKLSSGVNSLFGGQFDSRLSVDQNARAVKDALVTGGLSTIAAGASSDSQGFSPTGLQRIAAGALSGREAGSEAREDLRQQNLTAQLQGIVDSGQATPSMLNELFLQSVANGNTDMARALSEVIKSSKTSRAMRTQVRSQFNQEKGFNEDVLYNSDTGEQIRNLGRSAQTGSGSTRPRETLFDEASGRMARFYLNPDGTKEFIAFTDDGESEGSQRAEEQDRLMVQMRVANQNLEGIDHHLASLPAQYAAIGTNPIIKGAINWYFKEGNPGESPETQEAIAEALAFVNSGVRFFSGQQMTTQEFQRYWVSWMPQPGEGAAGQAAKARKRALIAAGDASGRWVRMEEENPDMTRADFADLIDREAADIGDDEAADARLFGGN